MRRITTLEEAQEQRIARLGGPRFIDRALHTQRVEILNKMYPSESSSKLGLFQELFKRVKAADGDLAEFGTYNGRGARLLSTLDLRRTVWIFDTFAGMPPEDFDGEEDKANLPGRWLPAAPPERLFEGLHNIVAVQGRFAQTFQIIPPEMRFVLVHVDCDWYRSYVQVLEMLAHHMVQGGIAVLDDYDIGNCFGAKRAVDEFVARMGTRVRHEARDVLTFLEPPL